MTNPNPVLEIPLVSPPQTFSVTLNQVAYELTVRWRNPGAFSGETLLPGAGYLDIADANGNPIVQGIPLVTGADLLAQYEYLGIGGALFVQTDYDLNAVPTFENLGQTAHLYWQTR
jgi:hypothetical protein